MCTVQMCNLFNLREENRPNFEELNVQKTHFKLYYPALKTSEQSHSRFGISIISQATAQEAHQQSIQANLSVRDLDQTSFVQTIWLVCHENFQLTIGIKKYNRSFPIEFPLRTPAANSTQHLHLGDGIEFPEHEYR
ncbi:uncharacterized protein LOC131996633 [Stomoxys calcitrans]|uniref:uncharacterized protein LOC131996633 n=1 Tax=Stomoxys calcitrans TaxID=35570 RepID=UPI0027E2A9CA|nr:uncharacterized protein LOC131996633 [Stomoxys calcitrans]